MQATRKACATAEKCDDDIDATALLVMRTSVDAVVVHSQRRSCSALLGQAESMRVAVTALPACAESLGPCPSLCWWWLKWSEHHQMDHPT